MSSQVVAALISGGAALVVALLGIAGAIAAQLVATRRAFGNSLRLFEQENERRGLERAGETRRENEFRFAEQRRGAYVRMLRTCEDLRLALLALNAAANGWEDVRDPETRQESPDERGEDEEWSLRRLQDAFPRWLQLRSDLDEVAAEIELLGSADARRAAAELGDIVSGRPDLGKAEAALGRLVFVPSARSGVHPYHRRFGQFEPARDAFLAAARADLGMDPGSGRPWASMVPP